MIYLTVDILICRCINISYYFRVSNTGTYVLIMILQQGLLNRNFRNNFWKSFLVLALLISFRICFVPITFPQLKHLTGIHIFNCSLRRNRELFLYHRKFYITENLISQKIYP